MPFFLSCPAGRAGERHSQRQCRAPRQGAFGPDAEVVDQDDQALSPHLLQVQFCSFFMRPSYLNLAAGKWLFAIEKRYLWVYLILFIYTVFGATFLGEYAEQHNGSTDVGKRHGALAMWQTPKGGGSMRDMNEVLERWGVWARDNSGIDYSPLPPGSKGCCPINRMASSPAAMMTDW